MSTLRLKAALDHYQSLCKTCLALEETPSLPQVPQHTLDKDEFIFDIPFDPQAPLAQRNFPKADKVKQIEQELVPQSEISRPTRSHAEHSKAVFDATDDTHRVKGKIFERGRPSKKPIKKKGYLIPLLFVTLILLVLSLAGYFVFDIFIKQPADNSSQLSSSTLDSNVTEQANVNPKTAEPTVNTSH